MIVTYRDTSCDINKTGGKAYNLWRLSRGGFNVPVWIALPVDMFFDALGGELLQYRLLLENYKHENRKKIIDLINNCSFTDKMKQDILFAIKENIGSFPVAVRSSAADEDGDKHSFAGMMDSYLDVDEDKLFESIKKCWCSCFSERAMLYRLKNGLSLSSLGMAVIIQKMVEPDFAGVIFTTNPKTNDTDEVFISLVRDRGEKLVSGECSSEDHTVDSLGNITDSEDNYNECTADKEMLRRLAEIAVRIEKMSDPRITADIEFCVKDSEIFILQSRAASAYSHIDKNKPRIILDNSNIIESYSGAVTDLTFSFAREVYAKIYRQVLRYFGVPEKSVSAIDNDLENMLSFYENKVYYKMNSWYRMTALYPGYETNRKYMENMMGVKKSDDSEQNIQSVSKGRIYFRLFKKYLTLKKDSDKFRRRFDEVTHDLYDNDFEGMNNKELLDIYAGLEREILDDFITPIANDMFAMVFYGLLTDKLKKKNIPGSDGLISELLGKQGNVESAAQSTVLIDIVNRIKGDKELEKLFLESDNDTLKKLISDSEDDVFFNLKKYIHDYGCRTMDELKLETVTMLEDSSYLIDTIKHYLTVNLSSVQKKPAEKDMSRIFSNYGIFTRPFIKFLVEKTKYLIRNRESLRLRRTYIYSIVRKIYIRVGINFAYDGIIKNPRDIFFLEKPFITDVIEGRQTDISLIQKRVEENKRRYTENKEKETYERIYFYGEMKAENAVPVYSAQEVSEENGLLHGVAGGGGTVTGKVSFVLSLEDSDVRGKILMAKRTDPGWTILFPMVKGIIIERGSILSHSAVIAREMGIPLVAGIRGLTDKIHDGDIVEVDGINGTVRVVGEKNGK